MKKILWVVATLMLAIGTCTAKGGAVMTREQREVGASAIDGLAFALPKIERNVIDDAYIALEKELDPKLYEKLESLNERAAQLKEDIQQAYDNGRTERDPIIVALKKEQGKVKSELEEMLYNGGPLHHRSILALGLAICVAVYAYKRANTKPVALWKSAKWGALSLVFIEVMLRGKYAYFSGKVWWMIRQLFVGLNKLVGSDSFGERGLGWFQEQMRGWSNNLDRVMGDGRGIWISLGVIAAAAVLVYMVPSRRTSSSSKAGGAAHPPARITTPPQQAGTSAE